MRFALVLKMRNAQLGLSAMEGRFGIIAMFQRNQSVETSRCQKTK